MPLSGPELSLIFRLARAQEAEIETYVLPDGGRLWDGPHSRTHKVGDKGIPSPVTYQHPGHEGEPSYELKFEVWNGVPVCTEVKLTAKPAGGVHIRPLDIKTVAGRLENSLHHWLAFIARDPGPSPGKWVKRGLPSEEELRTTRRLIESARGQVRRRLTDDQLNDVADAYNSGTGPGVEAVKTVFGVSTRTAWRYIKKARETGLIDE